jgi:hypothetical protein
LGCKSELIEETKIEYVAEKPGKLTRSAAKNDASRLNTIKISNSKSIGFLLIFQIYHY